MESCPEPLQITLMSSLPSRLFVILLSITLFNGCAAIERDKETTRQLAGDITLYLDSALVQRQDRGGNTLDRAENVALAKALAQRARQRLKEKGYRIRELFLTIGIAPDDDITNPAQQWFLPPHDNIDPAQHEQIVDLHRTAVTMPRQLPPKLLQQATGSGVMLLVIHGSLKSPLELQRDQMLDTLREMQGDHDVDIIPEFVLEGHYQVALYHRAEGRLLWNNWGSELLRHRKGHLELVEPALGSLP